MLQTVEHLNGALSRQEKQEYKCDFFLEHPNAPQIWNVQINGPMERTFKSMDLWTENLDI